MHRWLRVGTRAFGDAAISLGLKPMLSWRKWRLVHCPSHAVISGWETIGLHLISRMACTTPVTLDMALTMGPSTVTIEVVEYGVSPVYDAESEGAAAVAVAGGGC